MPASKAHPRCVLCFATILTTLCSTAVLSEATVERTSDRTSTSILPVPAFTLSQSIDGSWAGVAWANAYGDYKPELALTGAETFWYFYSSGSLTGGGGLGTLATPQSFAWGDYDNDGLMDAVSVSSTPLPIRVFHNEGVGNFVETTGSVFPFGPSQAFGLGWADIDRDWDLDLGVGRQGGAGTTFYEYSNLVFDGGLFGGGGDPGTGVAFGDYDNDRWPDVYVADLHGGGGRLFHNVMGTLVDVTTPTLSNVDGKGYHAEWADYDNDGDLDLYVANSTASGGTTTSRLFRNGNSTAAGFTDVTTESGVVADRGTGAWGDFDNDGYLDLYVQHSTGNRLYRNLGDGTFADVTGGAPLNLVADGGIAWADYDGDGYLDLAVANSSGAASILHSNGHINHWLHVDLVGTISNRWGIGARIQVVTGGLRQTREVSGSAGYLCQNSITAEFGLGLATTVDSVIVTWPTGVRQAANLTPGVDKRIVVTEVGSSGVEDTVVPTPSFVVTGPNPFSRSTSLGYALPSTRIVRIDVYDLAGRRVRTLVADRIPAGNHTVIWDGRDDSGARMFAGIYLCRIQADSFRETRRVALVP